MYASVCCIVCQFYIGVHCTDESPRRAKQPISGDVVFAVLHTCTWYAVVLCGVATPMWAVPQTVSFKASCDLIKNDSSLVC